MPKSRIEKRKEDREAALTTESSPNFSFFTWGAMIVLCMFLPKPEDTLACFVRKTSQPFLQFPQMPCTTNVGCPGKSLLATLTFSHSSPFSPFSSVTIIVTIATLMTIVTHYHHGRPVLSTIVTIATSSTIVTIVSIHSALPALPS